MIEFERAQAIADAVLLEGYALYPYRADSTKNRYRWTFGVIAPRAWSEAGGCEPWWAEAQVLVTGDAPKVRGRLRFLHAVDRRVEVSERGGFRPVDKLEVDGRTLVSWEEGALREIDFEVTSGASTTPVSLPAEERIEILRDASGATVGRLVLEQRAVELSLRARFDRLAPNVARVSVRVDNLGVAPPVPDGASIAPRAEAVRSSCLSAHVLLAVEGGALVSMIDPPDELLRFAACCRSTGLHAVLVGEPGRGDRVLCSPIILYDHPQIAPESPGDFFDACEIDALLALRTRTLTPDEKALARATDARTAEIVDRVDGLGPEALARLFGAVRERSALPSYLRGARVRLKPDGKRRRSDVHDLLYVGRTATVEDVRQDVDGRHLLAVTIDDDPAVEMHRAKGRFHYYYPDEVEPLGEEAP